MATAKRKSSPKRKFEKKPRTDYKQKINDEFLENLKTCSSYWERPWMRSAQDRGGLLWPMNGTTGKTYKGVNVVNLMAASIRKGYRSRKWATYDQWFKFGGGEKDASGKVIKESIYNVERGEKSTLVCYAGKIEKDETKPEDDKNKDRVFLKWSPVFNADQVRGWVEEPEAPPPLFERHEASDEFVRHLLATIEWGGDRACYIPFLDIIRMPLPEQFKDTRHGTWLEHFYSTLFHELGHWTGNSRRLDRKFGAKGTQDYAREELRAELIAVFLCAHLGINATIREDHFIYLGGYIRALEDHKGELFAAAADAQRALDWMIDRQPVKSEDEESEDDEEDEAEEDETAEEKELEDA